MRSAGPGTGGNDPGDLVTAGFASNWHGRSEFAIDSVPAVFLESTRWEPSAARLRFEGHLSLCETGAHRAMLAERMTTYDNSITFGVSMTLHYRKLMIASIAFPIVVVVLLVVFLPTLSEARSVSTFGRLRANIKALDMNVTMIEAINGDEALVGPIRELRETIANQQDALVDLREAMLDQTEQAASSTGPGWIALISTLVGIAGTLSSVLLSWRQDMREARAETQQQIRDFQPRRRPVRVA